MGALVRAEGKCAGANAPGWVACPEGRYLRWAHKRTHRLAERLMGCAERLLVPNAWLCQVPGA